MRYRPGFLTPSLLVSALIAGFVAVTSGASVPAAAPVLAPAATNTAESAPLNFLTPTSIDYKKLLPMPPKPDTEEAKAELDVVLSAQKTRTPEEIERAKSEAKLKMTAFTSVIGPWFTTKNLPQTEALIKAAESDSKFFSGGAKDYFNRKRPPSDPRVTPLIDEKDEPSYPSGHSTRGTLMANILAELDPEQRDGLMDRSREIGWDRIIAGVHYPSDIIAGRVLGQALAQAMLANPKFQEQLAAARIEFEAARKKYAEAQAAKP